MFEGVDGGIKTLSDRGVSHPFIIYTPLALPAKKTDGLEKTDGLGFVGFCGEIASLDLKRAYPVVFGCYCYRNHCDFWLPQ